MRRVRSCSPLPAGTCAAAHPRCRPPSAGGPHPPRTRRRPRSWGAGRPAGRTRGQTWGCPAPPPGCTPRCWRSWSAGGEQRGGAWRRVHRLCLCICVGVASNRWWWWWWRAGLRAAMAPAMPAHMRGRLPHLAQLLGDLRVVVALCVVRQAGVGGCRACARAARQHAAALGRRRPPAEATSRAPRRGGEQARAGRRQRRRPRPITNSALAHGALAHDKPAGSETRQVHTQCAAERCAHSQMTRTMQ